MRDISQVSVYSYFIRGLSHIQGMANLTHVVIELSAGKTKAGKNRFCLGNPEE